MALVAIKDGQKTIYRRIPENGDMSVYEPNYGKDLTTGGAKLIDTGMTQEQYDRIFKHKSGDSNG